MARRTIIAAGVCAGLLLGGVSGFAVTIPSGASAQGADAPVGTTDMRPGHEGADHGTHTGAPHGPHTGASHDQGAPPEGHGAMRGRMGGGGPGGPGGHGGPGGMPLEAAADAIGISADDLRSQLQGGQSLSAIAQANGVDTNTLIDTLTDQARNRITEMVNQVPGSTPGQGD
jgi:hypothetical protein